MMTYIEQCAYCKKSDDFQPNQTCVLYNSSSATNPCGGCPKANCIITNETCPPPAGTQIVNLRFTILNTCFCNYRGKKIMYRRPQCKPEAMLGRLYSVHYCWCCRNCFGKCSPILLNEVKA